MWNIYERVNPRFLPITEKVAGAPVKFKPMWTSRLRMCHCNKYLNKIQYSTNYVQFVYKMYNVCHRYLFCGNVCYRYLYCDNVWYRCFNCGIVCHITIKCRSCIFSCWRRNLDLVKMYVLFVDNYITKE